MDSPTTRPLPSTPPDPERVAALLGDLLGVATRHRDPAGLCAMVSAGALELPAVEAAGVLVRGASGALVPVGVAATHPPPGGSG